MYFHLNAPIEPGTKMELTFALPTERDSGSTALIRASAEALRVTRLADETTPMYGVAATIDRIDFVRPVVAHVAA
jgi:hypothetical protein